MSKGDTALGLEESEEVPAPPPTQRLRPGRAKRTGNQKVAHTGKPGSGAQVLQPQEVQAQPGQWKELSQEVSRQLDYQPGKFFWLETVRPKYVRVDEDRDAFYVE